MFDRIALQGVHGIYAIVRRETGQLYIGSSSNMTGRLRHHLSRLRRGVHRNFLLQGAWTEFGEAAFSIVVLEIVAVVADLRDREQWWLDAHRPFEVERGYNRAKRTDSAGYKFTPEQSARLSAALTGRKFTDEARAAMRAARARYGTTPAQRANSVRLGQSRAGVPKAAEHRRKIGLPQRGEGNHRAKLTNEQVSQIKRRLLDGEMGRDLAREFGVAECITSEIKSGKRWTHVEPAPHDPTRPRPRRRSSGKARLTAEIAALIKRRLLNGEGNLRLSQDYGVAKSTITGIKAGLSWADIEPAAEDAVDPPAPGTVRLTETQVSHIKRRLLAGVRNIDLAAAYSVTTGVVSKIKTGAIWAHVEPAPEPSPIPAPRVSREGVITHEPLRLF